MGRREKEISFFLSMGASPADYPEELTRPPLPLVCLVGLPELHRSLQESTGDLRLASIDVHHSFPPKKEKRVSYEGYHPAGLFKVNWLQKHARIVPAVIGILFEWDDDGHWRDREQDICTQLDVLRVNMEIRPRNLRLLVILVQRRRSGHGDLSSDERVNSLRKRAEMDSRNFFVFEMYDFPTAARRLDRTMHELAISYYREEARRIKKNREKVSKTLQPELCVRHNFKIAFFAEMRRDAKTALKYYGYAYSVLRDVPSDNRMSEVKTIADWLNFKLVRLPCAMGKMTDAIDQFRRHMRCYKTVIGPPQMAFEHWSWVSKQYRVFGEVLEAFKDQLLLEDPLHHPGLYYQAAATAAMERKKMAAALCSEFRETLELEGRERNSALVQPFFVGQVVAVRHDAGQELSPLYILQEEIRRAKLRELRVDHSSLIIALLEKAHHAARVYLAKRPSPPPRTILYLASQMADEYYDSGQFDTAKKLFEEIYTSYRKERWWHISSHILERVLDCATRTGATGKFIEYALEMISSAVTLSAGRKKAFQKSFFDMLNGDAPSPVPLNPHNPVVVNMDRDHPTLHISLNFTHSSVHVHNMATFELGLELRTAMEIRFSRLQLSFNNSIFNQTVVDTNEPGATESTRREDLLLRPHQLRTLRFEFVPTEDGVVEVSALALYLTRPHASIVLQWKQPRPAGYRVPPPSPRHTVRGDSLDWIGSVRLGNEERLEIRVNPPEPKLTIHVGHTPPALVNEFYGVDILLRPNEDSVVEGVLRFSATATPDNNNDQPLFFVDGEGGTKVSCSEVSIPSIRSGGEYVQRMYLHLLEFGERTLFIETTYTTDRGSCARRHETVPVSCGTPFTSRLEFFTTYKQQHFGTGEVEEASLSEGVLFVEEPATVQITLECASPHAIWLSHMEVQIVGSPTPDESSPPSVEESEERPSTIKKQMDVKQVLRGGDRFATCYRFVPPSVGKEVSLGTILLHWRRLHVFEESSETPATRSFLSCTPIALPFVNVERAPFSIRLHIPPHGSQGVSFTFSIAITNQTPFLQDLRVTVDENEAFLFAGFRTCVLHLLPHAVESISFSLLPLVCGLLYLPHVQVNAIRFERQLLDPRENRCIFIKPSPPTPPSNSVLTTAGFL